MGPRLLGSSAKRMYEREEGSHNLQTRMRCGQIPDGMPCPASPKRLGSIAADQWPGPRQDISSTHRTAQHRVCSSASAFHMPAQETCRLRVSKEEGEMGWMVARDPHPSLQIGLASLSPQPTGGEPVFAGCLASRDLPLSASGPGRRDIAFMWETPLAWSRAMGWWWPKNTGTQGAC